MSRLVVYFALYFLVLVRTLSGEARHRGCYLKRDAVFHIEEDPLGLLGETVFLYRSTGPPAVVSVTEWKCTWRRYLIMMLLLCEDISVNPGPSSVDYPCGVCNCEVSDSDPAVCCDFCDLWIHVSCDRKITLSEYQDMVNQPSEDSWICSVCESSIDRLSTVSSSTPCNYLSAFARSILPKRFDLIACLCTHHFDIVAVTETFLDSSIPDAHIIPSGYTIFRRDCNRHGGGVLVLIRNSITAVHRKD